MCNLKRVLREPLLHFALLGAMIFGLNLWLNVPTAQTRPRIEITAAEIEHLRTLWQRTWQRPPTPEELRGLIDTRVREEILYREALAMGLDKEDTVVRRRLVQKLEFLSEDVATMVEPNEENLERYFLDHAEHYREPVRLSFAHVYFSADRHGQQTGALAKRALQLLTANGGAPAEGGRGLGDHLFAIEYDYVDQGVPEVARTFGKDFADEIAQLPTSRWQGPVLSGFGLHLVYINDRVHGRMPALSDVRDAVLRDYEQARREEASQGFYARLKQRYEIIVGQMVLSGAVRAESLAEATR